MQPRGAMIRAVDATLLTLSIVFGLVRAAVLLSSSTTGPAWADGPGDCPPGTGWNSDLGACIQITIPGTPGTTPNPTEGTGGGTCHDQAGAEVPCSKDGLSWWGSPHWCYAELENPQSPPPLGHEDENGQWWTCQTGASGTSATFATWWVTGGTPPVDGGAVARQLIVTIPYELADAKIAPPPTYHTYISYKNWLWVESGQWHTVSASKSVGGATVTLTAAPSYVEWAMGNGQTISCVGPGRAWQTGMPEDAPTNCSYAYKELDDPEGDTWTVSARINYTLAWTCTGNCGGATSGDLGSQLAAAGDTTSITVYQRQTVVR